MGEKPRVVVATGNRHKFREIVDILSDLEVDLVIATDLGVKLPEESPSDMKENAIAKAKEAAKETRLVAVADDSGLEVDALGGQPGPLSSKFGGEGLSDLERCKLLLEKVRGIPEEARSARFRCVIAVATPEGEARTFQGTVEGVIAEEPRGSHGFGYDPIFFLPDYRRTMAELGPLVKNRISHRARALQAAKHFLLEAAKRWAERRST